MTSANFGKTTSSLNECNTTCTREIVNRYFLRTYDQQEIDLVEESSARLSGFECKWNPKKKVKAPGAWSKTYTDATYQLIHRDNYLEFIEG